MLSFHKRKWFRRFLLLVLSVFILMNVVAFFHAWKFTHFASADTPKTAKPSELSAGQKIKTLFFGVSIPKPQHKQLPSATYETIVMHSNKKIECWWMKAEHPVGSVILCHGFSGEKSSMISRAEVFLSMGYNCLLVDFMGSGNSEGDQTTVGYFEAKQVTSCFEYLKSKGESTIFLFGTSMGAVAIMKAIHDDRLEPKGIVLECPFGTMYKTTCARFRAMHAPVFPMAGMLIFWGGVQNGFWAFSHNPETYAAKIKCPVLLMSGDKDASVSLEEIGTIYENLQGKKKLRILKGAGHENYLTRYRTEWVREVAGFVNTPVDAPTSN